METTENYTNAFTSAPYGALYDLTVLEEMDDNECVLELLTILLSETPRDLQEMKKAVKAGKADKVYQAAHKLKGSAGIIQAEAFNALLSNIETLGKKGAVNKELAGMVDTAEIQYVSIEKGLKLYMQGLR
ncbi:MAG: Hpt domain-containing protein [Ferruginibacter sp.]